MEENLIKTCLHDRHVKQGALMSPFGGFDMPIQYTTIIEEHNAVRNNVGVFDVSHMGEVRVKGKDAYKYVSHIFVNDVTGAPDGQIFYGMMCYENGGTVDDLLVYKVNDEEYFLVINAANIDKDVAWIEKNAAGFDVEIKNESDYYGEVAVQGPKAEEVLMRILELPLNEIAFYNFKTFHIDGEDVIISRTGYTGEDGFEVYGSHEFTVRLWDKLMEAGVTPCGLAAVTPSVSKSACPSMVTNSLPTSLLWKPALACLSNSTNPQTSSAAKHSQSRKQTVSSAA